MFRPRLRHQLVELAERNAALSDQIRVLTVQVEDLRAQRDKAQTDALESRSMVADWMAQQMFGRPIYGSPAPQLPEEGPPDIVPRERVQGRMLVRQAEDEFVRALKESHARSTD